VKLFCCVCVQSVGSPLTNASSLSDTVLPSTPEGPGEMFVSPLGSAGSRLSGISRLMKTPKQKQRQSVNLAGVKALVKTPKAVKSPELVGVKRLMKTPKVQKSPALDGMRKLLTTPKDIASTPKLDGVRKLVKTPKVQKSPSLSGVKKLLKTPRARKSPQLGGLKTLMKTPKQQQSPVLAGVRQLMKTPKSGPKSPDFVGVNEMLTSPQTSGSIPLDSSRQKNVPKRKRAKEASSAVPDVLSPKPRGSRGRKIPEKTVESQPKVQDESISGRKRAASKNKLADEDDVLVSKKVNLDKSSTAREKAKSPAGGKKVRPLSTRGKSNKSKEAVAGSEEIDENMLPNVVISREECDMSEVEEDVSSSPKTSVRSSAKNTKAKKAADAKILSADISVEQPVVTKRKAVKTPAKKSTVKTVVTAGSSPRRLRGAGQASRSAANVASELALAADSAADVDSRKKRSQRTVADDSVNVAEHVAKKSRAAKKVKDTVDVDHTRSLESIDVDTPVRSKRSRSAKKEAAPDNKENKAKTGVKTTKGKELHVDLAADKPVASRRGKPAAGEQLESIPSQSAVRGKHQVVVVMEKVEVQQKAQDGPAAAAIAGGRRGKRQLVDKEPQMADESSKVKTPSRSQKRPQAAKGKESDVETDADKPVVGRRGRLTASKQLESTVSSNVSAKSPVSTRRGTRQIVVKETVPVVEDVTTQQKGKDSSSTARAAAGRKGKRDEPQQAVEASMAKTPSRSRKRQQTSGELADAPVAKRQREQAEEAVVDEQMSKKVAKQRGKSSASFEPDESTAKQSQKKGGTKKMSRSAVKTSGGDEATSVEIIRELSSSKKSGSKKVGKKVQIVASKSKRPTKNVAENKNSALVSPLATRSTRSRR